MIYWSTVAKDILNPLLNTLFTGSFPLAVLLYMATIWGLVDFDNTKIATVIVGVVFTNNGEVSAEKK